MSTLRQIEANRRNAQKSTGPTSATGKAVSSMNALKTGIHAKSLLLPSEKLADLEQLIDEYYQSHNPTTPEARSLVDDLIYGEWLKRRLRAAETQIWAYDHQENYRPDPKYPLGQTAANRGKAFAQLQWRMECTRRASRQALQDLQQLQAQAAPESAPAEPASRIGAKAHRNPHTPNHFTRNWLRSSHPGARRTFGPGTTRCPMPNDRAATYAFRCQKNCRKIAIAISTRAKVQTIVAPVGRSILSER